MLAGVRDIQVAISHLLHVPAIANIPTALIEHLTIAGPGVIYPFGFDHVTER